MEKSETKEKTMELFKEIRLLAIPKFIQYGIGVLLCGLLLVDFYVGYQGLIDHQREKWVEAGSFLLGTLLPISLAAILLFFSIGGLRALKDQTHDILKNLIPETLKELEDYPDEFFASHLPIQQIYPSHVHIESYVQRGRSDAEYKIYVPEGDLHKTSGHPSVYREILLRVELNVKKVNVGIYLSAKNINKILKNDGSLTGLILRNDVFPHSLIGAGHGAGKSSEDTNGPHYAYKINEVVSSRIIMGKSYHYFVLIARLPDDFLYETAEKLFFSQDLLYLIKSIIRERPTVFSEIQRQEIFPE